MYINILFTGKLYTELFTSTIQFTVDALYFSGIFNIHNLLAETWLLTFNILERVIVA